MHHKLKMKRKTTITGNNIGKPRTIGSKKGKKIIRSHHTLLKRKTQLEQAVKNDPSLQKELDELKSTLENSEALERYQQASISGQNPSRGGDSSKLLVEWLKELKEIHPIPRVLEVGSLSINNAIASYCKHIDRIDLNSQHPDIQSQDFMTFDIPTEMYDMVSLSLVVNFVPDSKTRGEMLLRTTKFLNPNGLLFFVLPAPCVSNSRYFTESRLSEIMVTLGYTELKKKITPRIAYWLYKLENKPRRKKFEKKLLNDSKVRNNFVITL